MTVDLLTGERRALVLPGGTLCRSRLLLINDRIVYLVPGRAFGSVMAVDVALRERPRFVAHADVMVPATESGRLWLGLWTRRERLRIRYHYFGSGFARRARHTAPLAPLLGAVPEGLVLGGRRSTFVWDVRTARHVRQTPGAFVLATRGSRIVSCGGSCRTLLVADGRRGRVVHAPGGARFVPSHAGFSTDGGIVAVPAEADERSRLALVDLATGTSRLVPHLRLGTYAPFAWSPTGETLYAVVAGRQIVSYERGSAAPRPVGLRFSDPVLQLLSAG